MMEGKEQENFSTSADTLGLVSRQFDFYTPPVLAILGGICNSLVIRVMMTSYFANVSTSFYMIINAVFDNVSLLVALPVHWLHVNFPEAIYRGEHADVICQVLHFLGMSTSDIGVLLTAAMTCERAFAIKFPLKAPMFCTTKKARYVTTLMILIITLKDGPLMVKSEIVPMNVTSYLCELDRSDASFAHYADNVAPVIHNVFLIICFLAIVSSNVIIVRSVHRSSKNPISDALVRQASTRRKSANNRTRQITIMLICDSVTIVLCTLPFAILSVIMPYITFPNSDVGHITYAVTFYLLYINRCANFFLYCVSGQRFRLALRGLFVKRSPQQQSVFSVNSTSGRYTVNGNTDCKLKDNKSDTQDSSLPS